MATALDLLMSTKEDVNLLSEESDICTIDAKTRVIFVPSTIVVGGVQSDKNAERIKFSCPKIVGDNLDLSKFSVRINFENVSSVDFNVSIKDQYICDDVAVDGENVTFSWLIGRNAARYMGTVRFIVCAVKTDSDSNISVEWNTTIAEVPVLEGIEIDQPQIGQEEKDVINQLLELTKNTSAEAVQNVNSAKEQAIKDIQSVSQPDTTLTIEGGLAEAKATGEAIGSLKEDLVNYLDVETKTLSYTKGKYINGYGTISDGSNYEYSEPFAMIKGEVLKVFMRSANGIIPLSMVKNVDSSYTPIVKTHTTDKSSWLIYTVETSGSYAICLNIANMEENGESPIVVIEHLTGRIKANEDDIQYLTDTKISYFENVELVSGKYISYLNGNEQTLNFLKYGVFKVAPNTKIIYKEVNSSPDLRGLAFFKEDGTFVRGYQMIETEQEIIVPSNTTILKATVSTYKNVVIINENTIIDVATRLSQAEDKIDSIVGQDPLDVISSDANFVSSFDRIGCLGDSLTAGNLNYNGSSSGEYVGTNTSYPTMLSKFTGNTVLNFGQGGASAKGYISIATNKGVFEDSNKCDAYIISLGTNDIGYNGSFDGDVTTDIDLQNYENNANTSVGQYAKLIQKILETQPKAKIFCSCIPNTRNTVSTITNANTKIKAIAELFQNNCYVMDFQTYGVKVEDVDDWKSKYYNGGHLNALGYNLFAKMVLSYMNWIIENNPNHFRNIGFIGTDYDWN